MTEIMTIGGAVLALIVLVGGLPFAGWLITRRRRTPQVLTGQRSEEMAGLHEPKLTALELAERRKDTAWNAYSAAHLRYVEVRAKDTERLLAGVESKLLAGAR